MDKELEAKVRARAYSIWERENRPDGKDIEHWLQAVHDIAAEEAAASGQPAPPVSVPPSAPPSDPKRRAKT